MLSYIVSAALMHVEGEEREVSRKDRNQVIRAAVSKVTLLNAAVL